MADLKVRFPSLQEGMKGLLSSEMEKVVREEKFLKEEPERLESALRRCKKLTGTLVTLKRYDHSLSKYRFGAPFRANSILLYKIIGGIQKEIQYRYVELLK